MDYSKEAGDLVKSSNPRSQHSSWMGWTLGLLAAAVVYVLTIPLVLHSTAKPYPSDPVWLAWYLIPYSLVRDFAPVRNYHDWCRDQLGTLNKYRQ